jgi:hypothetical protein
LIAASSRSVHPVVLRHKLAHGLLRFEDLTNCEFNILTGHFNELTQADFWPK